MDGKISAGPGQAINILVDPLPCKINGCKIETNFRTMVLFEQLIFADDIQEEQRLIMTLNYFWKEPPKTFEEAVNGLLWFYRCGEEIDEDSESGDEDGLRAYDFDEDSGYIYAAFMQQYGIDLQDIQSMHWWKFRALFNSLNENTRIVKIMQYRTADTSKMQGEERRFYERMKKLYRLKRLSKPEQEAQEIAAILKNGGDLSVLLGGEVNG